MVSIWLILISLSGSLAASFQYSISEPDEYCGGRATKNQFPFLVSVRLRNETTGFFKHVCGATILSERIILTAAHCLEDHDPVIEKVRISVGAHTRSEQGELYEIEQFIVHPEFDFVLNDVAVIRLKNPIPLNENATTISLDRNAVNAGEKAIMAGWGYTPDKYTGLKYTNMSISNVSCFHDPSTYMATVDQESAIIYKGDSGSPLINTQNELIGMVSWGSIPIKEQTAYGFTCISHLAPWIDEAVKNITEHATLLEKPDKDFENDI